jgi:hypothetical protein
VRAEKHLHNNNNCYGQLKYQYSFFINTNFHYDIGY